MFFLFLATCAKISSVNRFTSFEDTFTLEMLRKNPVGESRALIPVEK